MCTDITHKDFITVHHELAHIQYFLNYRNRPKVFRDGANPGNFAHSNLLLAIEIESEVELRRSISESESVWLLVEWRRLCDVGGDDDECTILHEEIALKMHFNIA